jgi:predicted nucleotidyltransferase
MAGMDPKRIQETYEEGLASLVEKLEQDTRVLAAILFGSLSYDEVWLNSDIDLWVIMEDGQKETGKTLCENEINIHAQLVPRAAFRKRIEGDLTGGWLDFSFSKSTLLFTKDESIRKWYENIEHVGKRDKSIQLMRNAAFVMPSLYKAEKYFQLKKDYEYSFWWLMQTVRDLASIEVIWNDRAPAREVVHQALEHNPQFFKAVYTDFVNKPKTKASVGKAIEIINTYLEEKTHDLFEPLLEYLSDSGEVRSLSEIDDHFRKRFKGEGLESACEWLTQQGIIEKLTHPIRLTETSRIQVEEPAYYYDGDAIDLV